MPGVTADLELDLADALRSIDQLDAALNQSIQSFSSSLAQSLDQLSSPTEVAVDVSGVTSEIDAAVAAADPTVTATVDADPAEAEATVDALIASFLGAPIVVPVDADTSEAQADISALADTAGSAASSLTDLATSGAAGGASLSAVAGGASGAAGALSGMGAEIPGLAAGIGAFTGLAAAGDSFFNSALNAEASTQRFNQTLGATANEVKRVNVGNLDTDLAALNLQLGSSTSQTRNAVSSFAQLGQAAGASSSDIAESSDQLVALSARAVALNPALGSVGDVAEKLSNGLARGGRFAAQYGIALTSAEINARALRDTGKSAATELTIYEKAAAGAAVATEKYGSSLKETIDQGAANPIIQLRKIGTEFAKFTTALGKPLIAPVFDLIRAGQPLFQSFASLVQRLLVALLPAVTGIVAGLAPLVDVIVSLLTPALDILAPILGLVGQVAQAFGESIKILVGYVNELPGPVKALIFPLSGLHDLLVQLGVVDVPKTSTALKDAAGNTVQLADGATLLKTALTGTPEEFAKMETTATGFAQAGVADELRRMGRPLEEVRKELIAGDAGFKQFVANGIKAGAISITDVGTGAKYTADQIANAKGNLDQMLRSGGVVITQGQNLVATFGNQAAAIQAQAKVELDATIAQRGLSQAQVESLPAMAQAQLGSQNYAAQVAVLNQGLANGTIQTNAQTAALGSQAATWVALAQNIAAGTITEQNADLVAQQLGLTHDQVTQAINLTSQAVDNFVNNAVSKVPTAASVFDSLKTTTNPADPSSLASNLNAATLSTLNFGANIEEIGKRFPEVAALLAQKGPEAAGALASTFLASTDTQKQALEDSIKVNEEANRTYGATIKTFAQDNITAATDLATGMTTGFGEGLDFDGVTKTQVDEVTKVLQDGGALAPPKQAANADGVSIGDQLAAGMALGIGRGTPAVEQAARDAVTRAKNAANAEAGIRSPSTLFAEIGVQMGAGMAVGLSDAGDQVVAEAESIVARAAAAIASPATGTIPLALPNLPVGAGAGGGFGGAGIGDGSTFIEKIEINVTLTGAEATAEKAAMVGSQIGDALAARLEAQQARVTARNV